MKKTKHFNISVPELGDVPDITQVSNAISDLEDATAGTLEIMKAEMQGTKITLTSVSRKTKRTGYYEGMSIRFKSPQDIEPNYLKTISVDDLGDQELSVAYKVNRNEYIDIVYEGNKFTAYPVVVQKTDSVSNNSSVLVGTAKGVKTAYDKGVEALNKANQAQSSANKAQSTADGKVSKSGDTMTGTLAIDKKNNPALALEVSGERKSTYGYVDDNVYIDNKKAGTQITMYDNGNTTITAKNLSTQSKEVVSAINELNSGKENKIDKKSGFNLDKSDSVTSNSSNTIATSLAVKTAYDKASQAQSTADGKFDKTGGDITGNVSIKKNGVKEINFYDAGNMHYMQLSSSGNDSGLMFINKMTNYGIYLDGNGHTRIDAPNLVTVNKEIVAAINELNSKCPYNIGDIYITTNSGNPSTIWLGTTWEKIEGRFLLGTSESGASKQTGGSSSVTLGINNMPSHSHSASQSPHSHTQPAHSHVVTSYEGGERPGVSNYGAGYDAFGTQATSSAGGDNTGSAQPSISVGNTGGGQAFSIMPPYFTVHVWVRIK